MRATTTPLALDLNGCMPIDGASIDCTDALARAAQAPSFHQVILAANQDVSGCALLRVTTAAKDSALGNASGIGFWSTQAVGENQAPENAGRLVAKHQLKPVGNATLKNGAPATLHVFAGVANCPTQGPDRVTRLFKSFMEFDGGPSNPLFHNWELSSNHRIGGAVTQIDRSADILR